MTIENLNAIEARILGTLLEKSLATPDHYPLTLNALGNACNQKTCRDPVSDYQDEVLKEALSNLKRKCLVTFIPYGSQSNQFKFRHFMEDPRYNLFTPDLALLSVLLLRGPQTLNDLRIRTATLHAFTDLLAVESALQNLSRRTEPLTQHLEKRPGWKETRWQQLLFNENERSRETGDLQASSGPDLSGHKTQPSNPNSAPITSWQNEVALLKAEIQELRNEVADLRQALGG